MIDLSADSHLPLMSRRQRAIEYPEIGWKWIRIHLITRQVILQHVYLLTMDQVGPWYHPDIPLAEISQSTNCNHLHFSIMMKIRAFRLGCDKDVMICPVSRWTCASSLWGAATVCLRLKTRILCCHLADSVLTPWSPAENCRLLQLTSSKGSHPACAKC